MLCRFGGIDISSGEFSRGQDNRQAVHESDKGAGGPTKSRLPPFSRRRERGGVRAAVLRAVQQPRDLTLDGHGEEVDVLEGLDLVLLHQAAELGDRHPLLVVVARAAAAAAAPPSAVAAAPSEATAA